MVQTCQIASPTAHGNIGGLTEDRAKVVEAEAMEGVGNSAKLKAVHNFRRSCEVRPLAVCSQVHSAL